METSLLEKMTIPFAGFIEREVFDEKLNRDVLKRFYLFRKEEKSNVVSCMGYGTLLNVPKRICRAVDNGDRSLAGADFYEMSYLFDGKPLEEKTPQFCLGDHGGFYESRLACNGPGGE